MVAVATRGINRFATGMVIKKRLEGRSGKWSCVSFRAPALPRASSGGKRRVEILASQQISRDRIKDKGEDRRKKKQQWQGGGVNKNENAQKFDPAWTDKERPRPSRSG